MEVQVDARGTEYIYVSAFAFFAEFFYFNRMGAFAYF